MSDYDFDQDSLAEYLHIAPDKIVKMTERGKLPGRKVAGKWRFSKAEIHHWLEDRIGASDEEELIQVEGVLDRSAQRSGESTETVSVMELLPREAIAVPLQARTRNSAIHEMVSVANRTGWLWEPDKLEAALKEREDLHPTAMDNGVALLHPRRPLSNILAQPFLALGITAQGLPFSNARGILTDVFFMICSTDERSHLRILARLSRLIGTPGFLRDLRGASDPRDAHEVIEKYETQINA